MGEAKRRVEKTTANSEDPGRDEIVVVAAVEVIKRAREDSGEITAAVAIVATKNRQYFTVGAKDGEPLRALLDLNPDDVVRFAGVFTPAPRAFKEKLPPEFGYRGAIDLRQVALIERGGQTGDWREECFSLSRDRLPPDFRRRVAGCRVERVRCVGCGGRIETADQIALILLMGGEAGGQGFRMVCCDCAQVPRDELLEKLSLAEGAEASPAPFVTHAMMAE
jgi:hypothetical protein